MTPAQSGSLSSASFTGRTVCSPSTRGRRLGAWGSRCRTIATGMLQSLGRAESKVDNGSSAPAEPPMTTAPTAAGRFGLEMVVDGETEGDAALFALVFMALSHPLVDPFFGRQ